MKNLIKYLYDYLLVSFGANGAIEEIMISNVHHVTENAVSVIWSSGVEEHLRLDGGLTLYNINHKVLQMSPEAYDDTIIIDNGELFDGSRDQFKDSFFDNAGNEQIINWCRLKGVVLSINGIKAL